MGESQDRAAFTALCVTVGPSRAEYVQQVMREARETLARSRGDNYQSWEREEPLGVPERRSRERPLASRDRSPRPPTPAPPPDTQAPTWAEERAAVLAAIRAWDEERAPILDALRALCDLCETLHARVSEIQKQPWHPVYREMKQWGDAECAGIEQESLQQKQEEPLDVPPLRSLRQ